MSVLARKATERCLCNIVQWVQWIERENSRLRHALTMIEMMTREPQFERLNVEKINELAIEALREEET